MTNSGRARFRRLLVATITVVFMGTSLATTRAHADSWWNTLTGILGAATGSESDRLLGACMGADLMLAGVAAVGLGVLTLPVGAPLIAAGVGLVLGGAYMDFSAAINENPLGFGSNASRSAAAKLPGGVVGRSSNGGVGQLR